MSPGGGSPELLVALLVAAAVALLVGGGPALVPGPARARRAGPSRRPLLELAGLGVAVVLLGSVVPVRPLVLAALTVAGVVVLRLRASGRAERDAATTRLAVLDACEALVGELRAGRPLTEALDGAARAWPGLREVAVRARMGGDVPAALEEAAGEPGAVPLRRVSGAWALCAQSGSGLAHALELVLETVRADQDARRQVRTELAATRATARMVSALPLLLLLGAQGAGARPWHVLLATLPGQVCLLAGVVLVGAGLLWIEAIARSAVEDT